MLSEAQAWRKIAPWVFGWVNEDGMEMCGYALIPAMREFVGPCNSGRMRFRLDDHYVGGPSVCASSEEWALFCLLLAHQAEEDSSADARGGER